MNLNQITIPSTNVSCGTKLYEQQGLVFIVCTNWTYAIFETPEREVTLRIHFAETILESGILIYFEVKDVVEKITELKKKGIIFEMDATP